MAFAYVQNWLANGGTTAATSNTLTVSGATANNLLVAIVSTRFASSSQVFTTPSGWTPIQDASGNLAGACYYRIASGTSSDNFAASWSVSQRWSMAVAEYSGLATSSVLEFSTENDTLLNSTTNPVSSGSATPSTAGAAIAFIGISYGVSWVDSDITIDSSFTKNATSGQNVSARPAVAIASLDLSSTSSVNPSWTSAVAVQATYPVIAVFAEPSSGAYSLDPVAGTVAVTGSACTLDYARGITPTSSEVTVTGTAIVLDADRVLDLSAASVAVTGGTLTLTHTSAGSYNLDPLPATVSVTGAARTLGVARTLSLAASGEPGPLPFVATSAGAGTRFASPTGSGSSFTIGAPGPVRTAISGAAPGDVVFLLGGVYDVSSLRVNISVSGTASQPITIESYPGETAIFQGTVSGTSQNAEQSVYLLGDHIRLRNIEIRNTMGYAGLVVESGANDNLIEHVYSHDNIGIGIQNYGDRNYFLSCTANDNSDAGYTDGTFDDGNNSDGISISRGYGIRVEHCTALRNSDDGIDMWGAVDSYVAFCIVGANGLGTLGNGNGIKAGGNTPSGPTIVEYNLSYQNRSHGFDTNGTSGVAFRYNSSWNNGGRGFWLYGDVVVFYNHALDDVGGATGGTGGTVIFNSWQGSTLTYASTSPASEDFLKPVEAYYQSSGAYAPVTAATKVFSGYASLNHARNISPTAGSVSVTGSALTLTYAGAAKEITPVASTIVITGGVITLTHAALNNYALSPMAPSINVVTKNLKLEYSGVNLSKINGVTI